MPPMTDNRTGNTAPVLTALLTILLSAGSHGNAADVGETLHNGIVLPSAWPPHLADFATSVVKDPVIPPYLVSPPPGGT